MNRTLLHAIVFALGLLVVAWIGAGYVGRHGLALLVTALIAALYLVGTFELWRYRRATAGLGEALRAPPAPEALADWLAGLDPSLRGAVRQRIADGQSALPAPGLAPHLVGLLVLLGMLGTLLGMLVTLRGTGLALQSASELQAVRDALAAPVEGLGVAFGTSIAGVAASAALGLLAALCRRERAAAARALDAARTGPFRVHGSEHQREQSLRLMQQQADALPALVERMDAMMAALERQSEAAHVRQAQQQDAFQAAAVQAWQQLGDHLAQALERSAAGTARAAAGAVEPVVAAAMDTVTREAARLNAGVAEAVERQLATLGAGIEANAGAATALWERALEAQAAAQRQLGDALRAALDATGQRFIERSDRLLDEVSARLDATAQAMGEGWREALSAQQVQHEALAAGQREALDAAGATVAARGAELLAALESAQARQQSALESAHARQQALLAGQDGERFAAWREQLVGIGAELRAQWTQAAGDAADRHAAVAEALARASADIGAQSQAHAAATIAEISRLVDAASEAPRAAAEVVAELRQKLSESMVRDTAMLAERTQMMETLATLLDAVDQASGQQRGAIEALVSTSAQLLEEAGTRFGAQVEAGSGAIAAAVARVDAHAEGASRLGEALSSAVEQLGERNAQLAERLDAITAALEAAGARSDEQLAYYVAQARELVDLSVLAQKQIIGELRQLPAGAGA